MVERRGMQTFNGMNPRASPGPYFAAGGKESDLSFFSGVSSGAVAITTCHA